MFVQLTAREHHLIFTGGSPKENLERFFWMWTMKEAYTKALGIGLGFDFKRVEFDVEENVLRIDGVIPTGWKFRMFILQHGEDSYEGVVAEFLGYGQTEVIHEIGSCEWLRRYDAVPFVEQAILRLSGH